MIRYLLASAALLAAAPAVAQHTGHGSHPPQPSEAPADDAVAADPTHPTGALGPYSMSREASGTAWQPDGSPHGGVHASAGGWQLMGHALINAAYSWQEGPRGDDKAFVSGGDISRFEAERATPEQMAALSAARGILPLYATTELIVPNSSLVVVRGSMSLRMEPSDRAASTRDAT